MKKIYTLFFTICCAAPVQVFAQLSRPSNSYGLAVNTTPASVFMQVANFILAAVAVLTVTMIIVSGIMYITAAGDSGKAEKAKGWLTTAVTGLVVVLLSYVIVAFVSRALGAS